MDFESPDVAKDFPGLYASESMRKSQSRDSDYSDDDKMARRDLLGKKKDKKESKKDKGYKVFEGESSDEDLEEARSPGKSKRLKTSFKFPGKDKKEKHNKGKDKDSKDKKEEKEKVCKKESKENKKESKDTEKVKVKKKKESKLLKIKDKKKKSVDQEIKEEKPIFGVPLHVAVERSKSHDGIELPVIVREFIDYIEEHGLMCEGIYRTSGLKSKLRKLKNQYNQGEKVYLYEHEPHIIASLLKQFLRDLPEPILTSELAPKFEAAAAIKNPRKRVETLQMLMNELPNCNRLLLSWIFIHMMHVVSLEKRNKMNLQNVFIVLSPTMQISHNILQAFFSHSDVLFKGIELKKYVPPIDLDSSRLSLELPDSPQAIADELSRQENILNVIHAELNAGLRDHQKEEQLWEIQRIVTQLKRKLRFLRQVQDTSHPSLSSELQTEQSTAVDSNVSSNIQDQLSSNIVTEESTSINQQSSIITNKQSSENTNNQQSSSITPDQPTSITGLDQQPSSNVISQQTSGTMNLQSPSKIIEHSTPSTILSLQSTLNTGNKKCLSIASQQSPTAQVIDSRISSSIGEDTDKLKRPIPRETVTSFLSLCSNERTSELNDSVCTEQENGTFIGENLKKTQVADLKPELTHIQKESVPLVSNTSVNPAISGFTTDEALPSLNCTNTVAIEEELESLIREEKMERIRHEELLLLGDELRRKIHAEKLEISKLKLEVQEYIRFKKFKQYSFDSTDNSSTPDNSDDSDSSAADIEEDLRETLKDFIEDNILMKKMNDNLVKVIMDERDRCINIKVQMKMMQLEDKGIQDEHLI